MHNVRRAPGRTCSEILAILVSLLTKPKQPDVLESGDELVRQNKMKWIIEAGSGWTNLGEDAEEGTTLRLDTNTQHEQ